MHQFLLMLCLLRFSVRKPKLFFFWQFSSMLYALFLSLLSTRATFSWTEDFKLMWKTNFFCSLLSLFDIRSFSCKTVHHTAAAADSVVISLRCLIFFWELFFAYGSTRLRFATERHLLALFLLHFYTCSRFMQ